MYITRYIIIILRTSEETVPTTKIVIHTYVKKK